MQSIWFRSLRELSGLLVAAQAVVTPEGWHTAARWRFPPAVGEIRKAARRCLSKSDFAMFLGATGEVKAVDTDSSQG